jgi:hypothetical protein
MKRCFLLMLGALFVIALAPARTDAHGTIPQVHDPRPGSFRGEYYPGYYNYHRSPFAPHYSYRPANYLRNRPYHYTRFYTRKRHRAHG